MDTSHRATFHRDRLSPQHTRGCASEGRVPLFVAAMITGMTRSRSSRSHPVLARARLSSELADLPRRLREREFVKVADELWLPRDCPRDLETLSVAYSRLYPLGVLTGWSAAVLHGVREEDGVIPELNVGPHGRARKGLVVRRYEVPTDEVRVARGVRITSPLWTAFDLARFNDHLVGVLAVEKFYRFGLSEKAFGNTIDALAGTWGAARARRVFADADPRSESPPETETRLFLRDAGFTGFVPQVEVQSLGYRIDLADPKRMIAIEYVGEYHDDPVQQSKDRYRRNRLQAAGWIVIEVDRRTFRRRRAQIVEQVRAAYRRRGVAA